MDLVRAGDDRAFGAIHERYEARLLAYARQLLGGAHHDAEEVVQDAFVRALHALRADEREMALKAWLYTIVRNRALDVCAARSARPTSSRTRRPVRRRRRPARALRPRRGARRARGRPQAAARAPARPRSSIHELGGASHRTIARRLDVTTGGSKALVSRARAGLAQARAAA